MSSEAMTADQGADDVAANVDVEQLWAARLAESSQVAPRITPEVLADRYGAETREEIEALTTQASWEMIDGGWLRITLEELDAAARKVGVSVEEGERR